jgi:hypothetical protein
MPEARETTSIFLQQQIPTDFSCLRNMLNCLPCNVDGITERRGYFLVFELKHGETLSVGQERMLKAWAAKPDCTILIIDCQYTKPNEKNAREFHPFRFFVLDVAGNLSEEYATNAKDFAVRYDVWTRTPSSGVRPFASSAAEFEKEFLIYLPLEGLSITSTFTSTSGNFLGDR